MIARLSIAVITAASALALGAVGGRAYLWCAPMEEARLHCCCPVDEDLEDVARIARTCCEPRAIGDLLDGTDPRIASLGLVIAPPATEPVRWSPRLEVEPSLALAVPARRPREIRPPPRDGPGERLHARCSVYLL
ncbi:MAG: hypothetical protein OHK0013_17660 [Sandaracinaceae bacterium]